LKTLFLAAFGGGLIIAVYAMLHGVEKVRATRVTRPAPYLNLPAVAAFLVAFGATGYLLVRNSSFATSTVGIVAVVAGGLGWFAMTLLLAKWALRPGGFDAHLEAEEIQGQPAVVVTSIGEGQTGSIRYTHRGHSHEVAARNIESAVLPSGTEVVIDRFEDDVAFVENWASVEKRL
jgi:hypothetical protein